MLTETDHCYRKTGAGYLPNLVTALLLIISIASISASQTVATAEAYVERGNQLFKYGYLDQAIADYTKAIELKPTLPDAYNNRGLVYNWQKKWQLAIADLSKAIQLSPQNPLYYKNRAVAYSSVNLDLALADLAMALKYDPKDASTWNAKGLIRVKNGSGSGYLFSIDDFSEAIKLRPDYAEAYKNRGDSYRQGQKYELSIADYTKAIQLRPDYSDAYSGRARAYKLKYDFEPAIADITRAIQLQPKVGLYYYERAQIYLKRSGGELITDYYGGKRPDIASVELAIADLTTAIQLRPDTAKFITRARAYCLLGRKDLAAADVQKATELGAKNVTNCQ